MGLIDPVGRDQQTPSNLVTRVCAGVCHEAPEPHDQAIDSAAS